MRLRIGMAGVAAGFFTALALVAVPAPDDADAAKNGWQRCGRSIYGGGLFIYAKGVGCEKGRQVANKAGARLGECIDEGCEVLGFRCTARPNEIEGGAIVCVKNDKRIRFNYGG